MSTYFIGEKTIKKMIVSWSTRQIGDDVDIADKPGLLDVASKQKMENKLLAMTLRDLVLFLIIPNKRTLLSN